MESVGSEMGPRVKIVYSIVQQHVCNNSSTIMMFWNERLKGVFDVTLPSQSDSHMTV